MDFKKKYIKYKYKYLELKKLEQLGGEITEIPDNFYHVMSVTKAVIGILYHIHEKDYPEFLPHFYTPTTHPTLMIQLDNCPLFSRPY